ncbi:ribosomal L28e protein family-domain-containing protein [Thelonectria olida]|uniref:Ribosomal L28e protein family-domain-containing protein n=1 Tax=Thelonectria olida TaxID=1576542 RepID=A0A9P8WC23_9HYPO|nr:ribosomal L28e protein family-domain-containing protein [Thelonectria olida]
MSAAALPNISSDLVWEIVRNNNSFFAKSKKNGGVQLSRDPLNLTNKASRKHAGFVNEKAVGVQTNGEKGIILTTKRASAANKPAKSEITSTITSTQRKTYQSVANVAAKNNYRADLRSAAVERASAIRKSQRPVKADPEPKLRGKKKAAAAAEEN